jgi:class 3 adenylate cyclase/tetratricopeptide (TPR) repeat protein
VNCPKCGHDNREGARFCGGCAATLAQDTQCPACGTVNPPGQKFCDSCGRRLSEATPGLRPRAPEPRSYTPKHLAEKILTSRSALEGERKQVTVLFADVKGSMELAEQVDPEEWHRIMDRFFAILSEGVHRFEGTINQYTGDGIMALFGAPIAHEDHARRACYAALHLMEELRRYADDLRLNQGLNFAVRMGLNSGEVVVGKIGEDLRMDYTAQGHTVGLAARMEQIAEARSIYLTDRSAQLVEGFFRLRDLGLLAVKGVQDRLRVYELQGVGALRTRLDVSRARGFSKFVGRTDEMAALEAALERAIQGNGQAVGVVGEAGVGKSRLCYEFTQQCRTRGIAAYQAHAVAHGKSVPLLPVLELLRAYFGITEQDSDQSARDKIAGRLVLLDETLKDGLPLMLDLLGVSDPARPVPQLDPEVRQRQLFETIKRLTRARSQREAAFFLFEDLHWIDGASEAFLENLIEAIPASRTLLLVNFRPEYHAGWMQKSYYQQVPLLPLGAGAIGELLQDLLGTDPSLGGLGDRIRERTGGNPFFIEEVVQTLAEARCLEGSKGARRLVKPIEEAAIPATVQAVLSARIDRLPERAKQVLQTASVIGRSFSEPVLNRVVDVSKTDLAEAIQFLLRAEFIYQEALYPVAEYAFKHPLTQDVAYGSLLGDRRARLHAAVAAAVEQLYAEKLDELSALLAHHWEGAGESFRAVGWHRRAAEWAGMAHLDQALGHWRKARRLLDSIPESAETMAEAASTRARILWQAIRFGASEEEVAALFTEGRELAERSGDSRALAEVLNSYGIVRLFQGEVRDGVQLLSEARLVADQTTDKGLRVAVRWSLVCAHIPPGHLAAALECADQGLELAHGDPKLGTEVAGFSPALSLLSLRAALLGWVRGPGQGVGHLDRALALAREHADLFTACVTDGIRAWLCRMNGEGRTALAPAREAVEIAERIGINSLRANAYGRLGIAYALTQQWDDAVTTLNHALGITRAHSTMVHEQALILAVLSWAQIGSGDCGQAQATAEEALAVSCQQGAKLYEVEAHIAVARALLANEGTGASREIERSLARARDLVGETGAIAYLPFLHEQRANLAHLSGDNVACERAEPVNENETVGIGI